MKDEEKVLKIKAVKEILAKQLGIEIEDITNEDTFYNDLHMDPTGLTDFTEALSQANFDTSKLDISHMETIADLFEQLGID